MIKCFTFWLFCWTFQGKFRKIVDRMKHLEEMVMDEKFYFFILIKITFRRILLFFENFDIWINILKFSFLLFFVESSQTRTSNVVFTLLFGTKKGFIYLYLSFIFFVISCEIFLFANSQITRFILIILIYWMSLSWNAIRTTMIWIFVFQKLLFFELLVFKLLHFNRIDADGLILTWSWFFS